MADSSHQPRPDAVCDGGDLDCGSGLLLIIRKAMAPLAGGDVLEVRSREGSVREDLPAWCRMVGHTMLGIQEGENGYSHYLLRKKGADQELQGDLQQARDHQWQARVRWTGGMAAKAFVRNHAFAVGQPASFDTEDAEPSAIEYLLAAVGGALAVGLQWRLSRAGATVNNLEVVLKAGSGNILVFLGLEDEGDPALSSIEGKVYLDTDAEEADAESAWKETLRRCPVTRSLLREVPVHLQLRRV